MRCVRQRSTCCRSTSRATRRRCSRDSTSSATLSPRFVLVEMRDTVADRGAIDAILGERYIDVDALSPFDILYARTDVARAAD